MEKSGEPFDVADGCLFSVSADAKYMTGSALLIDGGYAYRCADLLAIKTTRDEFHTIKRLLAVYHYPWSAYPYPLLGLIIGGYLNLGCSLRASSFLAWR